MLHFIRCILFFITLIPINAQNLIPNPGFEQCDLCDNRGFKELGIGFGANVPADWNSATYGSPDFQSITPRNGKRHGGFFTGFPKFEYLTNHFTECLKKGAKYQFRFFVSADSRKPNFFIDEIGVYIQKDPANYPIAEPLKQLIPVFETPDGDYLSNNSYREFSFEYLAQGGEDHFIVGRFRALGKGDTLFAGTKYPANPAAEPVYYFVDDFEMIQLTPGIQIDLIPDRITLCPGEKKQLQIPPPYNTSDILWSTGEKSESIDVPESDLITVEIRINDHCNTILRDTTRILIENRFTPIILGPELICHGDTLLLTAHCDSCTDLSWTEFMITEPGSYTVTANSRCGPVSATHIVTSYQENFTIDISGSKEICSGDTVLLIASCPPCKSFSWNNSTTTSQLLVTKPGQYNVTAKSNCSTKTATVEIKSSHVVLDSLLQFPNVVFPQGEELNRKFKPLVNPAKKDSLLNLKLSLFNRWGQLIYEKNSTNAEWSPATDMPMDSYIYYCEIEYMDCNGPRKGSLKGTVSLIR